MAYNTRLSTVMDVAPADDVASDVFLCPSLPLRLADTMRKALPLQSNNLKVSFS